MEEEDLINVGTSPKDKLKLNAYLQNTGKVKNEVDPKHNKIKLSTSQYLQNTSIGKSKYDENLNFGDLNQLNIDESVNEHRAQEESNLAKIGAGIGRIGTKAISEIAKMPGVVVGGIMALGAKEGEGMETAFNNQWIKSISQFNEDVNAELLPVYVKKAVSEGNLWDNISSIDFWATEGADGIGFIASMFAPGAALKSLNLGEKILGTTAKGLSMVNGEAKLAGAVRTLEGLGVNAKNIDLGAMTMANTLFESGSEAGSAMESFQKDLDRRLTLPTTDPNHINEQQYEQLQTQKAKLGRDIFVSNLAILLVPNAIQTKMIWGKGVGSQLVKDTPSLMAKIGNRGKNVLGALGSEGFLEEGTQSTVETMFTNKAKRGELTDNMSQNFNISELVSNYIDTLNTTEGQKAIFLGGILGGGMSAYQGAKSDMATRKETQDVLSLAEEKVGVFNRVNETDVYKRDENGDVIYNYNNQPQYDPVKVKEVAKALQLTEEKSKEFDKAIKEGNEQGLQVLKNEAINQLITPFINKGELGIQALSQYLDTTLQTQEIAENEDAKALKGKIIEQATYMQDQLNTYKDFSKSLINLNNPDATEQDTVDYYNRLGDVYINLKGSEYSQKEELKKLNIQKSKLLKDLGTTEISTELNPNYIEGKDEEIYKFNRKPVDPRVKLLNDQIEIVDKKLSEIDKIINDEIWNNEKVNKSFNKRVEENNKLREQASSENEVIVDQAAETIANATTVDELKNLPKTNTPADTVIQQQANVKKSEIIATEEAFNNTEREVATQEDNDFNNVQTYDGLTATEGSNITDELIPQENENNTLEELKSIENAEVDSGLGVKVISTDRNTGLPLQFISEQFPLYLEYERNPVNKSGKEVGFEINQTPGKNPKVLEALDAFNRKDFSNPKLLIDFLPINVQFTNEVKAPIETRRVNDEINPATELLRISIVNHLINGGSITDIKTTIQDQYKGLLKVDENRFANNNILQLDGVKDLKYVRDNLYVVDSFGNLMNIQSGKTKTFSNGKTKKNAAGEIYLSIPQANGKPFPLKLNIKKISESEAVLLYEIYKEIITNEKSLDTTVSEVNDDLREAILKSFEAELNIIGGNKNDIKLQEIVDLLIYQSNNIKSRMQIENGVLYYGENEANINNIEESQNAIINYLVDNKRHQIKINPKFATDNTKTNLKSNSADYLKYLIDNNILSTNAVVNEPTFQGYTNIYLNTGITVTNQAKSDIEVKKLDIEKRRELSLLEGHSKLKGEDFDEYFKEVNSQYDAELADLNQPKVSESGVEISSNNFESLDFGDKKVTTQPITGLSITYTPTGKQSQTYTIDKTKIFNSKGEEVFKEDSADRRKIFANVAVKEGRAKVIEDNKGVKYVVNNKQQIMSTATGKIMEWAENHATRKLLIDKYNSSTQPKVSESGVEVQINNTGFDEMFNTSEMGDDVLDILKEFETEPKVENNSQNTRNVQENFVSLSEIKGTVENTELKETQAEVFKENKIPPTATEMRLINKAIAVYQKDATKLTEIQKKRLEEYATNYPESWKKICK